MIKFDKKQDKIAIIAPASGCKNGDGHLHLEKSLARLSNLTKFFKENGFKYAFDPKIFTINDLGYFAAPKIERLKQLKQAILDPEVKIIFTFRGGYGSADIAFDCIDISPSKPKILIGFSDITVLHLLFRHYKLPSIHGSMDAKNDKMLQEIISVLNGGSVEIELENISYEPKFRNIDIEGEIIGGNLTILCSMLGTKLSPITKDKILFLEDINEEGYQVHRHLLHMYHAGLFNQIKALIIGEFSYSDQHLEPTITSFIKEYLSNIPVYRTNQIGHGDVNLPITIGAIGKIQNNCFTIPSLFKLV